MRKAKFLIVILILAAILCSCNVSNEPEIIDVEGINTDGDLLNLLGFEKEFDIYEIRYQHHFDSEYESTSFCFKTDIDYTQLVKSHKGYYEDYLDNYDEEMLMYEATKVAFGNQQEILPENERVAFERIVKCDTFFTAYSIKTGPNSVAETTNSIDWYLIDDGDSQYVWVVNYIPEIVSVNIKDAVNTTDNN